MVRQISWREIFSDLSKKSTKSAKINLSKINLLNVNESRYIALFVVSGSIKKLFSFDYVNIYLFSMLFSIDIVRWKSVGLPHIPYVVIH